MSKSVTHSVKAKKMSRVSKNIKRGVTSPMKRKFVLPFCRSRLVQSNKWKMTKHLCLLRHKRFRKLRARYKRSGVNITNILRTALTLIDPESVKKDWQRWNWALESISPTFYEQLQKAPKILKYKKLLVNDDEIDTSSQFHHHFMSSFFTDILVLKKYKANP